MAKIVVADLHQKLIEAGLPVESVALDRPGKPGVSIDFQKDATAEQKALAEQIVKDYDQDAVEAAKPKPVSLDDINNANTVTELKALMIRQYQTRG